MAQGSGGGVEWRQRAGTLAVQFEGAATNLALALMILLFIILFLIQPVRVEGTSMEPQLVDQERVFVNKMAYRFSPIRRGDVVVFHAPEEAGKSYIKRVIGLPGETVQIVDGRVYLNGRPLAEPYVPPLFFDRTSHPPVIVPEDHVFVLGDHRNVSNDSRHWGVLPHDNVFGKAVFKYWPPEEFGLIR